MARLRHPPAKRPQSATPQTNSSQNDETDSPNSLEAIINRLGSSLDAAAAHDYQLYHVFREAEADAAAHPHNLAPCQFRRQIPEEAVAKLLPILPDEEFSITNPDIAPQIRKVAAKWRIPTRQILFHIAFDHAHQGQKFFVEFLKLASFDAADWDTCLAKLCNYAATRCAKYKSARKNTRFTAGILLQDVSNLQSQLAQKQEDETSCELSRNYFDSDSEEGRTVHPGVSRSRDDQQTVRGPDSMSPEEAAQLLGKGAARGRWIDDSLGCLSLCHSGVCFVNSTEISKMRGDDDDYGDPAAAGEYQVDDSLALGPHGVSRSHLMILPIAVGNAHWVLGTIRTFGVVAVHTYDSMSSSESANASQKTVDSFMGTYLPYTSIRQRKATPLLAPMQTSDADSGCYVFASGMYVLANRQLPATFHSGLWRRIMASCLGVKVTD
ncbi:hypothetical protein EsH8_XIV_000013 [Colletotrichum jinshuiense]